MSANYRKIINYIKQVVANPEDARLTGNAQIKFDDIDVERIRR